MKPLSWFRMWAEAVDDEKLRLLAFEDRWHFVGLLCLKAQGILDERDQDLRKRKIGIKLGLDSVELETVMKRLVTVHLIDERWNPLNWGKRQFSSDSSTNRVRTFRKRQRNVSETLSETETETETEKNSVRAAEPPTVDAAIFAEARRIFGASIGGQINRAIRERGKPWLIGVLEACKGKDPEAARAYLSASLNRSQGGGHDRVVV